MVGVQEQPELEATHECPKLKQDEEVICGPAAVESGLLERQVEQLCAGEADRTEGSPGPMRDVLEDVPNDAGSKAAERKEQHASVVFRVLLAVFLDDRLTAGRMCELVVKRDRWMVRVPPRSAFPQGK